MALFCPLEKPYFSGCFGRYPALPLPFFALTSYFLLLFPIALISLLAHLDVTGQTRPSSVSSALPGACATFHQSLHCPHLAWLWLD